MENIAAFLGGDGPPKPEYNPRHRIKNNGQVPTQIKDTGFGYDDAEDGKNVNKKGGVTQSESRREDIVLPGERPTSAFSERMRAQAGLHSVRLAELNDNLACPRYLHDHLRAVWYSPALKRRMCYYCAETCTDNGLDLIGGLEEMDLVEEWLSVEAFDSKLRKLNTGHEMLLNLAMLRCPCGTPFQSSPQSAICSMCCSATCSAACHKVFCQDANTCVYHRNFIPEAQAEVIGCRDIRWSVMERSSAGTYLSRVCGPRYVEAIMGHDENTLLLRRGYGQYGQPVNTTLVAMTALEEALSRPGHSFRRNTCLCKLCGGRQPHGVLHSNCPTARKAEKNACLAAAAYSHLQALPQGHPLAIASRVSSHKKAADEAAGRQKGGRGGGGRGGGGQGSGGGKPSSSGSARPTAAAAASAEARRKDKESPPLELPGVMKGGVTRSRVRETAGKDAVVEDEEI